MMGREGRKGVGWVRGGWGGGGGWYDRKTTS